MLSTASAWVYIAVEEKLRDAQTGKRALHVAKIEFLSIEKMKRQNLTFTIIIIIIIPVLVPYFYLYWFLPKNKRHIQYKKKSKTEDMITKNVK